jgi:hypothetical protein
MKFFSKLFWFVLPFAILIGTYREANTSVRRYISMMGNSQEALETYKDMQGIANLLAVYYKSTQQLPVDFKGFLAEWRKPKGGDGKVYADAWATDYQLRDLGEKFELVSCGPDKDCKTEHDNLVEVVRKMKAEKSAAQLKLEELGKEVDAHEEQ